MDRIKNYLIVIIRLIIPIFLMIYISYNSYSFITINKFNIFIADFDFSKVLPKHPRIIISVITFICLWFSYYIINRKLKKELIPNTIYCYISFYTLLLSSVFLGIKEINLKMKPIPLQFRIFNHSYFFIILNDDIFERNINYICKDNKKNSNIVNLAIGDTYEITNNMLPKVVNKYHTIIVNRKCYINEGRFYSENLIFEISKIVNSLKKSVNEYNLFLYTNPNTNYKLYSSIFNTGRDNIVLNIYQADSKNNFIFSDKPAVIIKYN